MVLHVPALRSPEVVAVLRQCAGFKTSDIPVAVEVLSTLCGQVVPIKKLLLWVEMARQGAGDDDGDESANSSISLPRWRSVLQDMGAGAL